MHNYTLDTNNNIEKHLQQIQSIKSRLIRNNFLTEESLYHILNELIPNFNINAINAAFISEKEKKKYIKMLIDNYSKIILNKKNML